MVQNDLSSKVKCTVCSVFWSFYWLKKVKSPSLLWIWNDSEDSSLSYHRLDDDSQVACKHYSNLEDKVGGEYVCELDERFTVSDLLCFFPSSSWPGTRQSTPPPSVHPVDHKEMLSTVIIQVIQANVKHVIQSGELSVWDTFRHTDAIIISTYIYLLTSVQYRVHTTPVEIIPPHISISVTGESHVTHRSHSVTQ